MEATLEPIERKCGHVIPRSLRWGPDERQVSHSNSTRDFGQGFLPVRSRKAEGEHSTFAGIDEGLKSLVLAISIRAAQQVVSLEHGLDDLARVFLGFCSSKGPICCPV